MNRVYSRKELAIIIAHRIQEQSEDLKRQFSNSMDGIGYFFVDDLLPDEIAREIHKQFPSPEEMSLKKSLRENKHVAAQMDRYQPILEEVIYAFQDPQVVEQIYRITKIEELEPDEHLYAGGLSSMGKDQFLNPHLDNSHDKERNLWRVLNLLYYVTPGWEASDGGHLELWPEGLKNEQITIHSKFNRLVVMATHQESWHSVSPVQKNGHRDCVSNYYFSKNPLRESDRFHVTTFRGRPGQKLTDKVLQLDSFLRSSLRKVFKKGIVENPHVYKKKD
ncbi:MAG: 2OG-Fe(II) oxygenase [Nonlabens sp.]